MASPRNKKAPPVLKEKRGKHLGESVLNRGWKSASGLQVLKQVPEGLRPTRLSKNVDNPNQKIMILKSKISSMLHMRKTSNQSIVFFKDEKGLFYVKIEDPVSRKGILFGVENSGIEKALKYLYD